MLHSVAAGCVLAVLPGAAGVALGLALFLLGLAVAWSRALLRSSASVRALQISGETLVLELAGGGQLAAEPAGRRYVSRYAVTLPLRRPRRTILVTPGMMQPDEFRRLRIWALWGRIPGAGAETISK